jgi:hypothetical protein
VFDREVVNVDVGDPLAVLECLVGTSLLPCGETSTSFGAIEFGVLPLSHEEDQNEVLSPLPMVTLVAALELNIEIKVADPFHHL